MRKIKKTETKDNSNKQSSKRFCQSKFADIFTDKKRRRKWSL